MTKTEGTSLAGENPVLTAQWDQARNGELKPDRVPANSHRKVWWKCEKGHSWQAAIRSRTAGAGCPVCANRKILPGFNDLETTHPVLAREWHPTLNGEMTPKQISYGHDRKVWWQCYKGHAWQATPTARVKMAAGCPICANYVALAGYNDLLTTHPLIAAQWHPDKNDDLKPSDVVGGSNRFAWWKCEKGHEWRSKIVDRTFHAYGCPYCANQKVLAGFNDLQTLFPEIAKQWHPTLNDNWTSAMVTPGSARRVWWQCPEGHVWRTAVYNRAGKNKRTGCPVCTGNVKMVSKKPVFAEPTGKKDKSES